MPVVLEQGASGRSFNLLNGCGARPIRANRQGVMPSTAYPAALRLTERQFIGLLAHVRQDGAGAIVRAATDPRGDFARPPLGANRPAVEHEARRPHRQRDGAGARRTARRAVLAHVHGIDRLGRPANDVFDLVAPRRPCGGPPPRRHRAPAARSEVLRRLRVHQGNRSPPAGRRASACAGSPFALERRAGDALAGAGYDVLLAGGRTCSEATGLFVFLQGHDRRPCCGSIRDVRGSS